MLISEAFERYRQDVIIFSNQSKKTEENHLVCFRALIAYFGDINIETLTFPLIRDWKLELDKHRSPETVRNYVIKLRVVLAYMLHLGVASIDPKTIAVPKRTDKVPDFISKEDVAKLIRVVSMPTRGYQTCNRLKNAAIIAVLYASGIRVSELCRLDRSDIHEDGTFTVIGKGGKARLCFLDDRALWLTKEYLYCRTDQSLALFISGQNGKRITPGGVQEVFRLARTKAGFNTPVHAHTLRHSFATNLLRNNANIRYVQVMLGHSSLETTQMYTHVTNVDLQKVYSEHHTV